MPERGRCGVQYEQLAEALKLIRALERLGVRLDPGYRITPPFQRQLFPSNRDGGWYVKKEL